MIYLFVFIVSVFCTFLAQKWVKTKPLFLFFSAIAILFPSALAGFRDIGIGTDTIVYSRDIFYLVKSQHYSFVGFLKNYTNNEYQGLEFVYLLLNYLVSIFFNEVGWFHFFANLIVVLFFYLAAYDNRRKASMWMVMLFFLFLFYNASLNIMRQSMAVAMSLYAFKHIENKEWIKSVIWLVIIFNTHSSGIFFAFLFIVHWLSYLKKRRLSTALQVTLAAATSLFFIYFNSMLTLLVVFSDRFVKYSQLYANENKTAVGKTFLVFYILILFIMMFSKKQVYEKQFRNISFYIYCKILGILFFLTSLISVTASRISWYLNVLDCIFIPRVLHDISLKNKRFSNALTFLVVFATDRKSVV